METQTKSNFFDTDSPLFQASELLLVFLPVLILVSLTGSWVGEDPFRFFVIVWIGNLYMLAMIYTGMKVRGTSWREIGLTMSQPNLRNAIKSCLLTLVVFVLGGTAYLIGPFLVAIFFEAGGEANFSQYEYLKDNLPGFILTLGGVYFISSFGEEVIFRGFLITRISQILRKKKYGTTIAVVLSSIFFGSIHYQWGPMGMFQTGLMGLVMGIFFIVLKRRLWILILAHACMDTILIWQLYLASN